ncbi:CoA-dependent acyltransferase [Mycena amicta]|nr:CoA-dependent acyltransferase [Mycena amicta]
MILLRGLRVRPYPILSLHARYASRKVLRTFNLADIGEGITECEVIRWSVAPSATVTAFDPLCEVQSDKASVEITSPFDGVVKQLLVEEGKVAKVGQGLCLIEVEEEDPAEVGDAKPETSTAKPETQIPTQEPAPQKTTTRKPHPLDPSFTPNPGSTDSVLATPSVRHYARKQGVDLANVAPGSGKGGRVEKTDVDAFLEGASAPSSAPVVSSNGKDVVVELGRTRAAMWKAMVKSLEVPHFGYSTTLDITDLHSLLPLLNKHIPLHYRPTIDAEPVFNPAHALGQGIGLQPALDIPSTGRYTRLTYLPFLLKTLAQTMMEWPLLRSSITPSSSSASNPKPSLTIRPRADIALALATPTGLYTPVLRAAETRNLYAIASDVTHLATLGRRVPSGLTAAHLGGGGTISVSNVGAAGRGTAAMPILVPGGGVAIVALGRAEWVWDVSDEWWGSENKGARRLKLPISWSADHRVVEGAELAAFVEAWRAWVENPARMIGEGL